MPSPIEEIKSRLDLAELIGSYVRLQKSGINFKANCPFHSEKTPSFYVSPTRQMWRCFGCSRGGDAFKFIMEIEGHDFPEALRLLAQRAGVVLRREDPAIRSERNRLYDLCEEAAKVFERSLTLTPAVLAYLKARGVDDDTKKEFRIGFSPQSWNFLLKTLSVKGFRQDEIEKAGLAIRSEDGSSSYDRFRSRIVFPIADANGRVIGFGGRTFALPVEAVANEIVGSASAKATADAAKYINTPNTLIYDKSKVLYGFEKAKQEIRTQNQVVIVEGYMDTIMSWQAGIKNTIAVSGTALTIDQLRLVKRLCGRIVCSFDTDAAGESATSRSLMLASEQDFETKIAKIPSGKDPADTVKEDPLKWKKAVEEAQPAVEFYIREAFAKYNPATAEGKKNIGKTVLPWMARLGNEIEKAHWVKELALKLNLPEESVFRELQKQGVAVETKSEKKAEDGVKTRKTLLEERFLLLLPYINEEILRKEFASHHIRFSIPLHEEILSAHLGKFSADAMTPELSRRIEMLKFEGEVLSENLSNASEEFLLCKRELEKLCIREELANLGGQIEKDEKNPQSTVISGLLERFRALSEKLKKISL